MSYFGYVAPDINKEVNWAKIGTDFADMLNKGEADREKRRQEIDKQTDEFVKMLNEAPQGQYASLNQWTLDYASDIKKSMLLLNRELKSGRLDPDKFIKNRQNLTDGTNSIFNLSKTWQAEYDTIEKRRLDGTGSFLEQDIAAQVEKLGRFKESKPFVNPTDYSVLIGSVGADGKVNTNPYEAKSPTVMTGLLKTRYDKFNTLDSSKKIAAAAGKDIRVVAGKLKRRVSDIMQRPDAPDVKDATKLYFRLEDAAISSALSNPDAAASVLVDTKLVNPKTGNAYELTYDPKQAGGDNIYMEFDKGSGKYTAKLTPEQMQTAKETVRDAVRYQLDYEETAAPEYAPQSRTYRTMTEGEKEDANKANMIAQMYYGNDAQFDAARDYFVGLNDKIKDIEKTPTVTDAKGNVTGGDIVVVYNNGDRLPISMRSKTIRDFVKSSTALTGISNIDQAITAARIPTNAQFSPATGTKGGRQSSTKSYGTPIEAWKAVVSDNIPAQISKNESDAVSDLEPILSGYGFEIEEAVPGKDYILIRPPQRGDKKSKGVEFRLSDPNVRNNIIRYLNTALNADELKKLAIDGKITLDPSGFNP
jgi:hypothetical protein